MEGIIIDGRKLDARETWAAARAERVKFWINCPAATGCLPSTMVYSDTGSNKSTSTMIYVALLTKKK